MLGNVILAVRCGSCFGDPLTILRDSASSRPRETRQGFIEMLDDWRRPPRPRDALGRQQPRRFATTTLLSAVGGAARGRVRQIPAAAIAENGQDEEGEYAFLLCPCDHKPVARPSIAKCSGCERWYFLVGTDRVYVVYGDMPVPPLRGPSPAPS